MIDPTLATYIYIAVVTFVVVLTVLIIRANEKEKDPEDYKELDDFFFTWGDKTKRK